MHDYIIGSLPHHVEFLEELFLLGEVAERMLPLLTWTRALAREYFWYFARGARGDNYAAPGSMDPRSAAIGSACARVCEVRLFSVLGARMSYVRLCAAVVLRLSACAATAAARGAARGAAAAGDAKRASWKLGRWEVGVGEDGEYGYVGSVEVGVMLDGHDGYV
jgi:hypothetical protein